MEGHLECEKMAWERKNETEVEAAVGGQAFRGSQGRGWSPNREKATIGTINTVKEGGGRLVREGGGVAIWYRGDVWNLWNERSRGIEGDERGFHRRITAESRRSSGGWRLPFDELRAPWLICCTSKGG